MGASVRADTLRAVSARKGKVLVGSAGGAEADAAVIFITPTMTCRYDSKLSTKNQNPQENKANYVVIDQRERGKRLSYSGGDLPLH